jgi:hypothetical protein
MPSMSHGASPAARQTPPPIRPAQPAARRGFLRFLRAHKVVAALVILALIGASVGVATLIIRQDFTATPAAHAPPVVFAAGDDAASLVTYGFASTPTISASGAAASMTIYGVPGATSVSLGEILELQNNEASGGQAYAITLSTTALPAGVTSIVLSFSDDVAGTPTARAWNLATTPTFTQYTLSPEEIWEFSAVIVMPASGALSAITISASITPV